MGWQTRQFLRTRPIYCTEQKRTRCVVACHIVLREAKGRHVSLSSFLQRRLRVHPSRSLARNYKSRLSIKSTPSPFPSSNPFFYVPWATIFLATVLTLFLLLFPSQSHPCPFIFVRPLRSNSRSTWSPRFVTYFLL